MPASIDKFDKTPGMKFFLVNSQFLGKRFIGMNEKRAGVKRGKDWSVSVR